ncbi:MAG: hypothetical protein ABUL44_03045 [Flavobacterium sp.]
MNSSPAASPARCMQFIMTLPLKLIERIIAILLILWATFELFATFWTLNYFASTGFEMKLLTWDNISYFKVFKTYHLNILVPLLSIFSATYLLLQKRTGWILTIAVCLINAISYVIFSLNLTGTYDNLDNSTFYFVNGVIASIYLLFLFLLLQRPFKDKYSASNKIWTPILIMTGIYLVDRIILIAFR